MISSPKAISCGAVHWESLQVKPFKSRLKQFEDALRKGEFDTFRMDVCPQLAQEMLKRHKERHDYAGNRKKSNARINRYAEKIKAGEWVERTGDSFKFDDDGRGFDGQHRLEAIIKAGKAITCTIVVGCDPKAMLVTDTGRSKTPQDILDMNGFKHLGSRAGGTIKQALFGMKGGRESVDSQDMVAYAKRLESGLKFVNEAFAQESKNCRVSCAPVRGVIVRAYYSRPKDRARLADFCRVLATGIAKTKDEEPLIRLRDYIRSSSKTVSTQRKNTAGDVAWQYRKVEAYLDQFLANMPIQEPIRAVNEERFPVGFLDGGVAEASNHLFVPLKYTGSDADRLKKAIVDGEIRMAKSPILPQPGDKIVIGSSVLGIIGSAEVQAISLAPRLLKDRAPYVLSVQGQPSPWDKPLEGIMRKLDAFGKFKSSVSFQKQVRALTQHDFDVLTKM